MTTCYIGIGSNLGDRRANIDAAIVLLQSVMATAVKRVSAIYETEPVSAIPQGRYLNGVIEIETGLAPRDLLEELLAIEERLGRKRTVKDAPRQIDLDILYYGDLHCDDEALTIPHPRLHEREFVLRGLRELGKI